MPISPTYPGVYIEEVPSGVRAISAVSTSNGAFVDFFKEGPSHEAVEVTGMADFDRVFGGLDKRCEASYAISQFFLNGGSRAWVVRVINEEASAGAVAKAATATIKDASGGGASNIMKVEAANEGLWGNSLRVIIDHSPKGAEFFHMRVLRHNSKGEITAAERYLNLSSDPASGKYFQQTVKDASKLVTVTHDAAAVAGGSPYARPAANGTQGQPVNAIVNFAQLDTGGPGPFSIPLEVRLTTGPASTSTEVVEHTATLDFGTTAPTTMRQLRRELQKAIRASAPTLPPADPTHAAFAGATVELIEGGGATPYQFVIHTNANRSDYSPQEYVHIRQSAGSHLAQLGFNALARFNVQEFSLGIADAFAHRAHAASGTAGADGLMPDPTVDSENTTSATAFATAILGDEDAKKGIYALEDADIFNILCMPLASKLPKAQMTSVMSKALAYCGGKRAFMIIDIPKSVNEIQEMKDWIDDNASFRDKNAAIYFPRLLMPDPKNEFLPRSVGCSGTLAGIYARTDSTRGVWKAPAGLDAKLRGITKLDYQMTDPENGSINPIAVNGIRIFPIHGQVAWGARTLDGADVAASEWKYISVRRLALMLEESLYRGTHWVVFEPNDEPTWAKVRQNVGAFMMNLFRQGAFQGTTPDKAFYVKCDGQTTTANDRNLGIVNIEVGFAPLKPAEFVVIKIQQIPDIA